VPAYTGCHISEALAFTADRVDLKDGTLIFEMPRSGARAFTGRFPFRRP
jgi:hypothetical protein